MMGMKDSTYILGGFLWNTLINLITSVASSIILKIFVFKGTSYLLLLLYIFFFGLCTYPWALIFASLFQKQWAAKVIGTIVFYGIYGIFAYILSAYNAVLKMKLIWSLLPQNALFLGSDVLTNAEVF